MRGLSGVSPIEERLTGETIFARATAPGRGSVAIIRISGPEAGWLLDGLTTPRPSPRQASVRTLRRKNGEVLDRALVLWFPGPRSFTGEDCAELHLHGGPAVIEAVSDTLRAEGGRPAGAGEFTQRAFLNGRIDLVEAEGLADLIEAETESQRIQALAQSVGSLSEVYKSWSASLRALLAFQEASIDFPDETGEADVSRFDARWSSLEGALQAHLADGRRGSALRRGLVVAVTGWPNVGKSSLVNALAKRDVSIVSARPGTTRDVVETRLVLSDVPIVLSDTAGLRDSDDSVEAEGVRRARLSVAQADIVLRVMSDGIDGPAVTDPAQLTIDVDNKVDRRPARPGTVGVSALTGEGLDQLQAVLSEAVTRLAGRTASPPFTRARHRDCLERCLVHLQAGRRELVPELRGEELRLALRELGRLTGSVEVEDILSDIFSTFCIGK